MTKRLPPRNEIPETQTWNGPSVFPSAEAWQTAVEQLTTQLPQLAAFQGHLAEGPTQLADWFAALETRLTQLGRIYVYANMSHAVDTTDQAAAAMNDQARNLYAQVMATIAFAEPELLAIGFETLRAWLKAKPRLVGYDHYLDMLERRQTHIRSAEVEELLGLVTAPFATASQIHRTLTDTDLVFEPIAPHNGAAAGIQIGQGNIQALLTGADREIRRRAWEHYADAHLAFKNTTASCLATMVKQHLFTARARRFGSALEAAAESDFVPTTVFHNLITTYRRHLPTWHRYWRVRRQALGYDQLHEYDVKAPLTDDPPHVPFDQAVEWVCMGMQPLGDEYVKIMRRGIEQERWLDIYPNQGKRSGAFSSGAPGTHPFIMLNHNDDLFGLSTLAHELGHSMHSYYSWQNQPYVYSDYPIFLAEVASNFNQALVRDYLFREQPAVDFQIALIEEAMSNFHRYFFIMPTLARFEDEIHRWVERGRSLTADSLIGLMADLFREGYGDEIDIDVKRVGITWAQFSTHLYLNFYVYQYATGISGAHTLAAKVLAGESGAVERYLGFLKAGSSDYPLETLKRAGVDLTTPEPVEQTFGVLAALVDRLERLIEQRQTSKEQTQ